MTTTATCCIYWPRVLSTAALISLLFIVAIRITGITNYGTTASFVDDVIYVDPAITLLRSGVFAAPGIAEQLAEKGIVGLDTSYHVTAPLNWALRAPFLACSTNIPRGKALADLFFLLILAVSFFLSSRLLSSGVVALYFTSLFLTYKVVGFAAPGRPDLLSAAFGLCALACVLYSAQRSASATWPFLTGVLCSLSLLAHQFGGIVWTAACLAAFAANRSATSSRNFPLRELVMLMIGGSLPLIAYTLFVLQDFENWCSQFFWLVELKKTLTKDAQLSLIDVAKQAIFRNPVALALIFASLGVLFIGKDLMHKKMAVALVATLVISIAWRVLSFEHYNSHYNVHFAALICLVGSLSIPSLVRVAADISKFAGWTVWVALLAALLIGLVSCIYPIASLLLLPHSAAYEERRAALEGIPIDARVLVSCDLYFEVDRANKMAMAHHERVDLRTFDYVVASIAQVPVADHKDQWFDTFTMAQASIMDESFGLVRRVPSQQLGFSVPLTPVQPKTLGLFLWRQKGASGFPPAN